MTYISVKTAMTLLKDIGGQFFFVSRINCLIVVLNCLLPHFSRWIRVCMYSSCLKSLSELPSSCEVQWLTWDDFFRMIQGLLTRNVQEWGSQIHWLYYLKYGTQWAWGLSAITLLKWRFIDLMADLQEPTKLGKTEGWYPICLRVLHNILWFGQFLALTAWKSIFSSVATTKYIPKSLYTPGGRPRLAMNLLKKKMSQLIGHSLNLCKELEYYISSILLEYTFSIKNPNQLLWIGKAINFTTYAKVFVDRMMLFLLGQNRWEDSSYTTIPGPTMLYKWYYISYYWFGLFKPLFKTTFKC